MMAQIHVFLCTLFISVITVNCQNSGCEPTWTSHENTNVDGGQQYNAPTLGDCQTACVKIRQCTGVDYIITNPPGMKCWLVGPWSGNRNSDTADGVTHYDIDRSNCLTSSTTTAASFAVTTSPKLPGLQPARVRSTASPVPLPTPGPWRWFSPARSLPSARGSTLSPFSPSTNARSTIAHVLGTFRHFRSITAHVTSVATTTTQRALNSVHERSSSDSSMNEYPKGWVYLRSARKYYRAIFELVDWNKAAIRCRQLGARSRLVDINDATENTAIKQFIASFNEGLSRICEGPSVFGLPAYQGYWTSGQRSNSSSCGTPWVWKTSAGSYERVTYTDWYPSEPDCMRGKETCLQLTTPAYRGQRWADVNCNWVLCPLCELDI